MKHKVSELEGALLDAAVAMAEGKPFALESHLTTQPKRAACWLRDEQGKPLYTHGLYAPSANWAQAGPIIERERMKLDPNNPGPPEGDWLASFGLGSGGFAYGPTPLIAAMRAYVASKFGDVVELP